MHYKYQAVDVPKCPGWWWCFPCPECEWYARYPNGLICNIVANDGCDRKGRYWPDQEGLMLVDTFSTDVLSFDDLKWTGALVGKWYGPIETPSHEEGLSMNKSETTDRKHGR